MRHFSHVGPGAQSRCGFGNGVCSRWRGRRAGWWRGAVTAGWYGSEGMELLVDVGRKADEALDSRRMKGFFLDRDVEGAARPAHFARSEGTRELRVSR